MSSALDDMSTMSDDMSTMSDDTSTCSSRLMPDGLKKSKKKQKEAKESLTTPRCSRVVPHHSTNRAQSALACEFGWDRAYYT